MPTENNNNQNIKAIEINKQTYYFKWTYAGWKQLTKEEEGKILLEVNKIR